jgi:hypothetical protein
MEHGSADPNVYLHQIAIRMKTDLAREEMETLLDELEYLYDIIEPELVDSAELMMGQLRKKLGIPA